MLQTQRGQKIKQPKGGQIRQAIPVDCQGAELQGNRIYGGVNKHGGILHG